MPVTKELVELLACQKCKGDLILTEKGDGITCMHCMLKYPIVDDIPIMVIEEATPIKK